MDLFVAANRPYIRRMRPRHLPTFAQIDAWPAFSPAAPLRIVTSGCLAGQPVGVDGGTNGAYPLSARLLALPTVDVVAFCPENAAFGTPRATPDIDGGDGFDVLDGHARVIDDAGEDGTEALLAAATHMGELARGAHLALMLDISATCGSSVIYAGLRQNGRYRLGPGVASAAILRAGVPVVSQRDERTLARIFAKLGVDPSALLTDGLDHHERPWYRSTFG